MSSLVKEKNAPKVKVNKLDKLTLFDVMNTIFMLVLLFITLYPVWYVLCISLSSTEAINSGTISFYPKGINFKAYIEMLDRPDIPRGYWNSILYTTVGTVCCISMTVLYAYPLSRKTFMFRKPLMIMVVITMFFGGGLIPTYLLVNSIGLTGSMWSLIIPNLIWTFDLIIMKTARSGYWVKGQSVQMPANTGQAKVDKRVKISRKTANFFIRLLLP